MTDKIGPDEDRREFLKAAGKFAVIVPPAMTFLMSTTMSSDAIAQSGPHGNEGCGKQQGTDGDNTDSNESMGMTPPGCEDKTDDGT